MHMYEDACVLCAVKLGDKASRINVRDRTSFSIEDELKNVPINVISKLDKVLTGQTRLIRYCGVKSDFSLSFYGFTLTSISVKDFLLYEIRVGSLNIYRSNGWL